LFPVRLPWATRVLAGATVSRGVGPGVGRGVGWGVGRGVAAGVGAGVGGRLGDAVRSGVGIGVGADEATGVKAGVGAAIDGRADGFAEGSLACGEPPVATAVGGADAEGLEVGPIVPPADINVANVAPATASAMIQAGDGLPAWLDSCDSICLPRT